MKYTKEFKLTLIKLVESGQSKADVSKEYEVDRGVLGRWLREHKSDKEAFTGNGNISLSTEQKTIRELEKKLRDMTIERDILKKAVHIFSRTS